MTPSIHTYEDFKGTTELATGTVKRVKATNGSLLYWIYMGQG
jgi:uncharacterized membrane protein YukC